MLYGEFFAEEFLVSKIKIIPLGGLGEIGKNMTVIEYDNDIIIVDCGMAFPNDDMPGVDCVIPDFSYVLRNKARIKGVVLTHGHEDHVGSLPYLLREIKVDVYATRLTIGLINNKLKEHRLLGKANLHSIKVGQPIEIGKFKIEFVHVNHSIPDAAALSIETPLGVIFHTGDFKIDSTPIEGDMIDIARISEIGKRGVLLMLCEGTNVESPGYTLSERTVGTTFDNIFAMNNDKRIIVATFSSNIHRIQQIINSAEQTKRKIAISGRSMENVISVAVELGYLKISKNLIIDINTISSYTPSQLVIITTGSQGEPMSALSRMASSDHKKVIISPTDLIIVSADPIPGNEKCINNVINELIKKGAKVIYETLADVHVSGHACQEEIKLIIKLISPQYFIPVHGEERHLRGLASIAESLGISKENIFKLELGSIFEVDNQNAKISGKVPSGTMFVDGLSLGDSGNIVLKDRKLLSQEGLVIVSAVVSSDMCMLLSQPDIICRGFFFTKRQENKIISEILSCAVQTINDYQTHDLSVLKSKLKNNISQMISQKTRHNPMVIPIITEV